MVLILIDEFLIVATVRIFVAGINKTSAQYNQLALLYYHYYYWSNKFASMSQRERVYLLYMIITYKLISHAR